MKNLSDAQRDALHKRALRVVRPGESLQSAVRRVARENRIVGLSLVLCHPDGQDEAICLGRARLKPDVPVTETTCFRAASVSKLVMTFGALSLMEDGLLDLDADISALLGFPVRHPAHPDAPVTLRMLLTHTSAIRDEGNYGTRGMESGCTLKELLRDPQNWLTAKPGESFHYSNLGAGVAGCVLERAANLPLETLMQQRVFAPLGIRASYDPRNISPADDLADGYSVRGILPIKRRYNAAFLAARPPQKTPPGTDYLCAAGRMITDSRGMAALVRLLASQDGMGVLAPESLQLMRQAQDGLGGISACGRGLNVAFLPGVFPGFNALGHQGVAYGMCAELFADPARGCGVGLLTSGTRLVQTPPLMRAGFDLLALGFHAING